MKKLKKYIPWFIFAVSFALPFLINSERGARGLEYRAVDFGWPLEFVALVYYEPASWSKFSLLAYFLDVLILNFFIFSAWKFIFSKQACINRRKFIQRASFLIHSFFHSIKLLLSFLSKFWSKGHF